jgi:peptidyl-prolyl cis-trans isomerase SurA
MLLGLTGLAGLTGCRTSPTVAAYVGQHEIGVDEISAAVDQRLDDPGIAAYAHGDRIGYARQVLTLAVTERVYEAAAEHYGVQVSDADVAQRIDTLLAGADPGPVYEQLAQEQGVNAEDVQENIRGQLVRERVAAAAGQADLSEAALQQRYQQTLGQLSKYQVGIITVPDQPTADAVRARLAANPAGYPAVAAQYPGTNTLPQITELSTDQVPAWLAGPMTSTPPGQAFTVPAVGTAGVVVGLVTGAVVPTFADVHDQLAQQAGQDAEQAGASLVQEVQSGMHITVNPRYGVLDKGRVVAGEGGVVQLLQDAGDKTAAAGGN